MSHYQDISGQTFNKLTAIERCGYKHGRTAWKCQCECGNIVIATAHDLKQNRVKSCGCISGVNTYDLSNDYGIGYTVKNEQFLFDLEDYDLISDRCWYVNANGYLTAKRNNVSILLHRIVTHCPNDMKVDHINHNKLDNRKVNLRVCTDMENSKNKGLRKDNKSGVTGVVWNNDKNKWTVNIRCNNKRMYLGAYDDFDTAVKVRKQAEEKYFGEWSYDNGMTKFKEDINYGICETFS